MTYSEGKTFMKKDANMILEYKSITTMTNESLLLTEDHLVYARKCDSEEFNPV